MITDTDITKLKSVFATKEELSELRADMRAGFAEVNGKFGEVDGRFSDVNDKFEDVGSRFDEVNDKIDSIAATLARMENTNDKYSGNIEDLRTENSMGSLHLARHDRQIDALALATKIALPS